MNKSIFSILFNFFPESVSFFSYTFLVFFVVSLLIYWLISKKYRWIILLVASIVFYLFFTWWFSLFVISATVVTYFVSKGMCKIDKNQKQYLSDNPELSLEDKKTLKAKNKRKKKTLLTLGIIFVVLLLGVMKYTDFVIDNIVGISKWFGDGIDIRHLNLLLPLGISFYTFQVIAYMADVYWGKFEAESNFFKYSLFVLFFPKIMQGPIIKYNDTKDEFFGEKTFNYDMFCNGLSRILYGLFKKVVIADCLAVYINWVFGNISLISGSTAFVGILAYFIQDYCDFSGYMDIIIGISLCYNIKMPENFCRPYFARTIEEYWRRWHITLGEWFKEYIFYPISMSKFSRNLGTASKKVFGQSGKVVPAIFGLIIVWFLTGLWHGASWNYVLWGLYYGFIIILNIALEPLYIKIKSKLHINDNHWAYRIFQHIRTILILILGRVIFITNSISDAFRFIGTIFSSWRGFDGEVVGIPSLIFAIVMFIVILVIDLIQENRPNTTFYEKFSKLNPVIKYLLYAMLIVIIIFGGYYGEGLPVIQFGYVQF